MIILGINTSHDSSVALLENEKVIFHLESERISNIKHDSSPILALNLIKNYTKYVDYIVLSGIFSSDQENFDKIEFYKNYVLNLGKSFKKNGVKVIDYGHQHHATHAATAFYNSGFKNALCVIKDGIGSKHEINLKQDNIECKTFLAEISSSFIMSYPNNIETVQKRMFCKYVVNNTEEMIDDKTSITNSYSEGFAYELTAKELGFTYWDAGKVMGLAAYGKPTELCNKIYKNKLINSEIFFYESGDLNQKKLNFKINDNFQDKANFAYALQSNVQKYVAEEIIYLLKKTKQKNLCLSGGFFLNCAANYYLLKTLPKNINIYVEPISSDSGTAIGAAKLFYYSISQSKKIQKQENIYLGPSYNINKKIFKNKKILKNIEPKDVAKLISEQNIVAIYQGKSESGPRALGNRSILYDPRSINGKDHVNIVKKRELFRPFAGSILQEEAKNWFDLQGLDNSKFMMFAVDVLKNKQNLIPSITHVDGTCRIQTVSKKDNLNFYNLIKEFYKITGIPILFNTSFNLAGNAIVETPENAVWTLENSEINYLYFPEIKTLIKNNKQKEDNNNG
jgi:carbamoyltransferase